MKTLDRLLEISSRLEHIENSAEWIAKESVHSDSAVSQSGTLITVLVEQVREKVLSLVEDLEEIAQLDCFH